MHKPRARNKHVPPLNGNPMHRDPSVNFRHKGLSSLNCPGRREPPHFRQESFPLLRLRWKGRVVRVVLGPPHPDLSRGVGRTQAHPLNGLALAINANNEQIPHERPKLGNGGKGNAKFGVKHFTLRSRGQARILAHQYAGHAVPTTP